MSQILNGLRKTQESRERYQHPYVEDTAYQEKTRQTRPKLAGITPSAVGSMVAILISIVAIILIMTNLESDRIKVSVLEKTIKTQEKRINDISTLLNKIKSNSDGEIHDLGLSFKNETQNMKSQIKSLASAFKDTYKLMLSNK